MSSARVDLPAISVAGLPGPVEVQVNLPSSWIARAIFASEDGVAVHVPASFP